MGKKSDEKNTIELSSEEFDKNQQIEQEQLQSKRNNKIIPKAIDWIKNNKLLFAGGVAIAIAAVATGGAALPFVAAAGVVGTVGFGMVKAIEKTKPFIQRNRRTIRNGLLIGGTVLAAIAAPPLLPYLAAGAVAWYVIKGKKTPGKVFSRPQNHYNLQSGQTSPEHYNAQQHQQQRQEDIAHVNQRLHNNSSGFSQTNEFKTNTRTKKVATQTQANLNKQQGQNTKHNTDLEILLNLMIHKKHEEVGK